jgi:phosphoribosylformimino-5-aminoimidazole carboxamide ribotide isomerase
MDKPFNVGAVQQLIQHSRLPTWVGGGVRDIETVRTLLTAGAERVIVGPTFWLQDGLLAAAVHQFPGQVIAMVDALAGYVANDSAKAGPLHQRVLDLALSFERTGAAGILYMEHDREDGVHVGGGLNAEVVADLAFALTIPLYVTGGINSMADLRALKAEAYTGIAGVVLGRALSDGRIDPITALAVLKSADAELS